ncbi:EscU/YscU/HrcU family type III secretion system export apparatus switch protein [Chloracidobacterium validum]|uniref:EscU/YscU/HrcU family type III secretion system export apparatus switch protein n=1 Tax=Chloracidobacterium validum TaxID=2821543 RepID=A0ABX8BDH6_9BACT|nr:EscU/YscU/HrcU family type III secretion system export apparatus switch protein [Chloracidobacterium validum]QUW04071.1 EscU/YscU/HrcU family type III secretion system export apparatus switch protein [Chloracidobacterium validum]
MSQSSGEKTEQPTQKKLDDARKKGQVPKSQDLVSAALLVGSMGIVFLLAGNFIGQQVVGLTQKSLLSASTFKGELDMSTAGEALLEGVATLALTLAPLFLVVFVLAAVVGYIQVGSLFSTEAIKPDMNRLNPFSAFQQKFFKSRTYIEFAKTILKLVIATGIASYAVFGSRHTLPLLARGSPADTSQFMIGQIIQLGLSVAICFVALGALDFFLQKFLHLQDLKMTKQEVKEEWKEQEGDPHIKAERRAIHMELLNEASAQAVKESDVVLVNPTHVAVAIRYDRKTMQAPQIVAKGADLMAAQIREIAREAGVPIKQDIPLARALYELEVNSEIPESLYEAIAIVLRWAYTLAQTEGRQ